MRRMAYELLDPQGTPQPVEGTLLEFLFAIPNLLHGGVMPPLRVLNHLLNQGMLIAPEGGCRWEPVKLTQTEYMDVVAEFNALSETAVHAWDAPAWVETYSDWSILLAEKLFDVPADQHLSLHKAFEALVQERDEAMAKGDNDAATRLSDEADKAADRLAAFLQEHLCRLEAAQG